MKFQFEDEVLAIKYSDRHVIKHNFHLLIIREYHCTFKAPIKDIMLHYYVGAVQEGKMEDV